MADIERFWCPLGGEFHLDSDGFLADPEDLVFGRINPNPQAISTSELRGSRAVVMLGEMGTGKSTLLGRHDRLVVPSVEILAIDLSQYGNEDRFVREVLQHPSIEQWKAASTDLALVLDGFDEAQERISQLGRILATAIGNWPTERLVLRIASRSVDWSQILEKKIQDSFGDLTIVGLLPLRRDDARAIAAELCDDPDAFLQAVDEAKASAFASRPQTLRMLARAFQRDGVLPRQAAELYDRGTRSLAEESNDGRIESGLDGPLTVDERIAVARRVATALTFGRSAAVWTSREGEVSVDDLLIAMIAGGSEPIKAGTVPVTESAVKDVLSTALFTSIGTARISFAHASFGDYLTAAWIDANGLSDDKVWALLFGPDRRARPQLRATAAWLVAINPQRFGLIATEDPESLVGQVDLPDRELRAAVIDGLFKDAGRRRWGWSDRLDGFRHPGIAEQIRPKLTGGSDDERRLGIKLARDCQVDELLPDLTQIALNPAQDDGLRSRAGYAAISIDAVSPLADLVPLVGDDSVRGADEMDELLGLGLLASWPHAVGTDEVFNVLSKPKHDSFFGSYRSFIDRFSKGLTREDVSAGLAWLETHLDQIASSGFADVADAIIALAAAADIDSDTGASLARIATARAADSEGLPFGHRLNSSESDTLTPEARHRLVDAIIEQTANETVVLYLSDRSAHGSGLIRPDDLEWVVAEASTATGQRLEALNRLFGLIFVVDRHDHVDLFLNLDDEHPIRLSRRNWVQVELGSEAAAEMKRAHELVYAMQQDQMPQLKDDYAAVVELLGRIESGYHQAFIELGCFLASADSRVDVTSMPRWRSLSSADRERITSAAQIYLSSRLCDPDAWVDDPSILHFASQAGYRALTLLLRCRPAALEQLSAEDWIEWAPIIATITRTINGPQWEDKAELLKHADVHAHPVLVDALIRHIHGAAAADLLCYWTNEVEFLFDDNLQRTVLGIVDTGPRALAGDLLKALARRRPEAAVPLLRSMFAERAPDRRPQRITAGSLLVDYDLAGSWELLVSEFDEDPPVALEVLAASKTARDRQVSSSLLEHLIADIYIWLRQTFDPVTDPQHRGAYFVGPRDVVASWRDQLLIVLRDRGTAAAIDALAGVARAFPTVPSIREIHETAMTVFSEKAWEPLTIGDLVRLAEEERSALVNTEVDLQRAVVNALAEIQRELTGANPQSHLLWDTHSGRPKSEDEISDHICNRLTELTGAKRLVVNREVQVRRNGPGGVPERVDIQVDAATNRTGPFATISLPIEVKGAWHRELCTAMESQLVARYMTDLHVSHGCYVVLWPDVQSWDSRDARRCVVAKRDRDDVLEALDAQARRSRDKGVFVEVIHLDVGYGRPKGT